MKRTYSSMQTSTPSPSTSTPSPPIGLEQFQQFALMFNTFSDQFAQMNDEMKKSKQGSSYQKLTTPQSSLGTDSDNDCIGIGSQSRTTSEKSDQTTESSSSKLPSFSKRKRMKIQTDHRHFKYEPKTLTLNEFKKRLATRLSDEVIGSELLRKFPSLHAFREEYIIPLTINFPGEKDIELSLMDDAETFRNGFENSYNTIFVQGCHIPRVPRAPGQPAIPETAERIQYRILIRDLWEILGLLIDMRNEPLLFRLSRCN